jgi:hypothetical protein
VPWRRLLKGQPFYRASVRPRRSLFGNEHVDLHGARTLLQASKGGHDAEGCHPCAVPSQTPNPCRTQRRPAPTR